MTKCVTLKELNNRISKYEEINIDSGIVTIDSKRYKINTILYRIWKWLMKKSWFPMASWLLIEVKNWSTLKFNYCNIWEITDISYISLNVEDWSNIIFNNSKLWDLF